MLDYFDFYLLPLAVKIGMTPNQFWNEDPDYFWAYLSAYEEKTKEMVDYDNCKAFNQGQYFMLAIAHCLQFGKSHKQIYPKKPLGLEKNQKVQMTQEQYEEIRKIQLKQMEERFNSSKRK